MKQCPFCSYDNPKVDFKSKTLAYNGFGAPLRYATASVRCKRCHARGPTVSGYITFGVYAADKSPTAKYNGAEVNLSSKEWLEEEAIRLWNLMNTGF